MPAIRVKRSAVLSSSRNAHFQGPRVLEGPAAESGGGVQREETRGSSANVSSILRFQVTLIKTTKTKQTKHASVLKI